MEQNNNTIVPALLGIEPNIAYITKSADIKDVRAKDLYCNISYVTRNPFVGMPPTEMCYHDDLQAASMDFSSGGTPFLHLNPRETASLKFRNDKVNDIAEDWN